MKIIKIANDTDFYMLLKKIGSTSEGIRIMKEKMRVELFFIKGIKTPAANILKQDALSIGAEFAVEKDTIMCKDERVDGVLIANKKQLKLLIKKERAQPFGLKTLAKTLKEYLDEKEFDLQIMGVLNANDDSFFQNSRFNSSSAYEKITKMIEDGVNIIDIGAVSSRPGSEGVSEEEEFTRLKDIVDLVNQERFYKKVRFSLDSYSPKSISYALQRGFSIINDITALEDDRVCEIASDTKATVVLMHMKGKPKTMQLDPKYDDVIDEVDTFFQQRIEKASRYGIDDLILDVGIGFGKRLEDNLLLLKHLGHFKHFNKAILVGASRKSMIDQILPTKIKDRLPATLAIHLKSIEEGASIIRVHDVLEHSQALSIYKAFKQTII
jgi:dihydropteroate synthase